MIDGLYLKHFKCFANQDIPFGKLTLLTGLNGTGKSTVIQSLLLLRQSVRDGRFEHDGLQLNAELLQIGTALDARYEGADDDTLEIGLDVGGKLHSWGFDAGKATDDLLPLQGTSDAVPDLPLFRSGLMHLSAERVGPRVLHPISRTVTERQDEFLPDGSLAVGWLHAHQARIVEPPLRHTKAASDRLREQVSAWMGEVSPGVNFKVSTDSELQIARLGIGFVAGKAKSRDFRPTGVGFGISQGFPVKLRSSSPTR